MPRRTVAVLIDLQPDHAYHRATVAAIAHAAAHLAMPVEVRIVPTDQIASPGDLVTHSSAIVIGPGSPYVDPDAAIDVIRMARESGVPLVGT